MLDGVDEVDWAALEHASKGRLDVPDILRRVAGPDADEAVEELYSTLLHQGTIYSATAAAVPFLVNLARHSPYARADVLWLLGDTVDLRQDAGPAVLAALRREIPSLLQLLDDDAADVRAAVAFPLARAGAPAAPLMRRWFAESDAEVLASLALALGEVYVPQAGPVLAEAVVHGSSAVSLAAALALMRAGQDWPDGTIAAVVDAIDDEPELPYSWVNGEPARALLVPLAAAVAAVLFPRLLASGRASTRVSVLAAIAERCLARRSESTLFIPLAGPALRDEDPEVRGSALRAVGQGGKAAGEFADDLFAYTAEAAARPTMRNTDCIALITLMRLGDPRWIEPACAAADRGLRCDLRHAEFTPAALEAVLRLLRAEPARADLLAGVVARWGAHEAVPDLLAALPHAPWPVTQALLVLGHDDPAALPQLRTLAERGDLRAAAAVWRLTGDAEPALTLVRRMLSGDDRQHPQPPAVIDSLAGALRPLLPEAAGAPRRLFAARVMAAAGEWEAAMPTIRWALAADHQSAADAATLITDLAPAHPALAVLEPELRRASRDPYSRVPAARALGRLGLAADELALPLVRALTHEYQADALTAIIELHAVDAIPALKKLVNQNERLNATNVVPEKAWADERLRARIAEAVHQLTS